MKKYTTLFLFLICSLCASAQNYKISRLGAVKTGSEISVSYPMTAIEVELLVEKEVVTPGVYARYAQKYLTMRAPLVSQENYKILDAAIGLIDANVTQCNLTPSTTSKIKYAKLPIDQTSAMVVLTAEDAAREAAQAIFTIRTQRRDIINGEAGEGYFGAGLKDAMDRLDKMEQEYLELFMGHRTITQSVKRFVLNPVAGTTRYVISRFDSKGGILPETDLTGAPIYLQLTPQALPDTSAIEAEAGARGSVPVLFRVAAPTLCVLYNDSELITSAILPIFEMGKNIAVETSSKR